MMANFYASQGNLDEDPEIEGKEMRRQASIHYREARQALLNDVVPAEDYNVKTSKLFHFCSILTSLTFYSLPVPNVLLLLLPALLLYMLREEQGGHQIDVRQEILEVAKFGLTHRPHRTPESHQDHDEDVRAPGRRHQRPRKDASQSRLLERVP